MAHGIVEKLNYSSSQVEHVTFHPAAFFPANSDDAGQPHLQICTKVRYFMLGPNNLEHFQS